MSDSMPAFPIALPSDSLIPHGPDYKPPTFADVPTSDQLAEQLLLMHAGLVKDEHGLATGRRFVEQLDEMTKCKDCTGECIKWKAFEDPSDEMIVLTDIPFVSLCNHHVIPFVGKVHIAYVPNGIVAGLSKFSRVVHHFARQLQVQERLTDQIARYLDSKLITPRGVGVVVQAEHMCMSLRGVQTPGVTTTTSAMLGVFSNHKRTAKAEFLSFIK